MKVRAGTWAVAAHRFDPLAVDSDSTLYRTALAFAALSGGAEQMPSNPCWVPTKAGGLELIMLFHSSSDW